MSAILTFLIELEFEGVVGNGKVGSPIQSNCPTKSPPNVHPPNQGETSEQALSLKAFLKAVFYWGNHTSIPVANLSHIIPERIPYSRWAGVFRGTCGYAFPMPADAMECKCSTSNVGQPRVKCYFFFSKEWCQLRRPDSGCPKPWFPIQFSFLFNSF